MSVDTRSLPKPRCKLVGLNGPAGNAFAVMGKWSAAAREAGWTEEQIKTVCDEAMSGDYANLLRVIREHSR